MTWLARLKKSAAAPEADPEKPTKPGSGGFGGLPPGLLQKSGRHATAANDPPQVSTLDREAFDERAAIIEFDGGISRIEAERLALSTNSASPRKPKADVRDRYSWPHTTAMNTAEIDAFTSRFHLLTRHGLDQPQAEELADGLVIRDRDSDDRRLCLECLHLRSGGSSWACNQWRTAGFTAADIPAEVVIRMQRCGAFKEGPL
ncbi:MAG: hypothetical protein E6Q31_07920 [Aquabacterium sp.]|nr:MAG: hypothetical protein E6Q31_07920 [Aquabacterium sp.]